MNGYKFTIHTAHISNYGISNRTFQRFTGFNSDPTKNNFALFFNNFIISHSSPDINNYLPLFVLNHFVQY